MTLNFATVVLAGKDGDTGGSVGKIGDVNFIRQQPGRPSRGNYPLLKVAETVC